MKAVIHAVAVALLLGAAAPAHFTIDLSRYFSSPAAEA
jgi:hypothetical protein